MASHVRPGKEAASPPRPLQPCDDGSARVVVGEGRPSEPAVEAGVFDEAAPITFVFEVGQRLQLPARVIGVASVLCKGRRGARLT